MELLNKPMRITLGVWLLKLIELPLCIILLFNTVTYSQNTIEKKSDETLDKFAERIKPKNTFVAHSVIQTTQFILNRQSIITLYGLPDESSLPDSSSFSSIVGYLYIQTKENVYTVAQFGPIEQDGGNPIVESVFFANADKDRANELFILCRYPQLHHDYTGEFYEVYIYDNSSTNSRLPYLEKLSNKFMGCECEYRNSKVTKAPYKTARAVRIKLKQLGYR